MLSVHAVHPQSSTRLSGSYRRSLTYEASYSAHQHSQLVSGYHTDALAMALLGIASDMQARLWTSYDSPPLWRVPALRS